LSANGKFSRANIDANNAINGNMTTEEGEKYTRRADETRLLIDELILVYTSLGYELPYRL
jgi:hypothetical protein